MEFVNGISYINKDTCSIFLFSSLTDDVKNILRANLSFICFGLSASESGREMYNYRNTLKNFIDRYESKNELIRQGMMGELLVHLVIKIYFPEFRVVSAFFNLEERSIKKGFDLVLISDSEHSLWLTEVKSGQLHKDKNSNETSIELLETAKRDLVKRINDSNSNSLWYNAAAHAKLAYEENSDLKKSIIDLIEQKIVATEPHKANKIKDMNVFLASTIFNTFSDSITINEIYSENEHIRDEKVFNNLIVIALQKETYNRIFEFLKMESQVE